MSFIISLWAIMKNPDRDFPSFFYGVTKADGVKDCLFKRPLYKQKATKTIMI